MKCSKCGRTYKTTAEERLLRAIYGEQELCPKCAKGESILCAVCGKPVDNPIYINEKPYHSKCAGKLYHGKS